MKTDFNAAWRKNRFVINAEDTPAVKIIKDNFNVLADDPGIGLLATQVMGSPVASVDVAMSYVCNLHPNSFSGPFDTGALAAQIGGSVSVEFVYTSTSGPQYTDNPVRNFFGIGEDFAYPPTRVTNDGQNLQIAGKVLVKLNNIDVSAINVRPEPQRKPWQKLLGRK